MKSLLKIIPLLAVALFAFSCGEKPDATDDSHPQSQNPSTQEPENPTPPVTTESIEAKVVSLNVRYPADSDTGEQAWDFRFPGICAMIEEVAPDIIGTQECYPSQREEILAAFPKYKAYGVRRSDGIDAIGKSETTSIIYDEERLEIVDKGTFWLSETPDVPSTGWDATIKRTTTWILFKEKESGKCFYHYNTHLDHAGVEAQKQGAKLIRMKMTAQNTDKLPVILSGDMNVSQGSEACKNFEMNSVRADAPKTDKYPTCHGYGSKTQQIDHIFYENCTAVEFKTLRGPWAGLTYISDHHPVMAVVKMK